MWSRTKIIDRIYWAVDRFGRFIPQQYEQVHVALQKFDPDTQFEILFTVLLDSGEPKPHFGYQEFAGQLLYELFPPCPLEAEEVIRNLVIRCDRSIKQVPWYCARQFGKAKVLEILNSLQTEFSSEEDLTYIATWIWWLDGKDPFENS